MTESIAIYADEILSRAADLTADPNTKDQYIAGVIALVARVVYPELDLIVANAMAGARIAEYIREGR